VEAGATVTLGYAVVGGGVAQFDGGGGEGGRDDGRVVVGAAVAGAAVEGAEVVAGAAVVPAAGPDDGVGAAAARGARATGPALAVPASAGRATRPTAATVVMAPASNDLIDMGDLSWDAGNGVHAGAAGGGYRAGRNREPQQDRTTSMSNVPMLDTEVRCRRRARQTDVGLLRTWATSAPEVVKILDLRAFRPTAAGLIADRRTRRPPDHRSVRETPIFYLGTCKNALQSVILKRWTPPHPAVRRHPDPAHSGQVGSDEVS
jgi:hypothetical protein